MLKYFVLITFLISELSLYAQNNSKIPFQGNITQDGIPIDGTKKFVFSITSVNWTETHDAVSITNGFYSVVLGSIIPLPKDLFDGVESRSLAISIDETSLGSLAIYAPFTTSALQADSLSETITSGTGVGVGYSFAIDGDGKEINRAIYGLAKTNNYNVGVQGNAISSSTSTFRNTGVYGDASGEGSGDHRGVLGYASSFAKYNKGVYGIGLGAGNGDSGTDYGQGSINFGLHGVASGNAWNNTGVEGSNYGTDGAWNFGVHGISNAGTGTSVENHGVAGRAFGSGINYGIYGEAGNGAENWAGYFNGNVQVNGNISATGDISGASITPSDKNLKRDIVTISDPLALVRELHGVRYTWNDKAPGNRPGTKDIGVIAQEVEVVLPELVKETQDGYKAVNYSQIVAVLIEAIKELDAEVNELQVENTMLKASLRDNDEIQQLKDKLESIEILLNLSNYDNSSAQITK